MRVGIIGIAVYNKDNIQEINNIISENSEIIHGRVGIPMQNNGLNLISLIVEGDTDVIGKMAGKIGAMDGVEIKSMLMKEKKEKLKV
ncbi:MAG: CopG family transcriptional regulator [Spirochaetales bacterium]|nr:CopG family transcriptional regulator [Spirochaetales bacterium]